MSECYITSDWNHLLDKFDPQLSDVYFLTEYANLYNDEKNTPECFVYSEKNNIFLFIYLKRKIELTEKNLYDFETPYGYGGIVSTSKEKAFYNKARQKLLQMLEINNIIAGFVRFNPLSGNILLKPKQCETIFQRKTVSIDLTKDMNEIWSKIHSKHRNVIRKAESYNLEFFCDYDFDNIDLFIEMYKQTMERKNAGSFYLFDIDYFKKLKENIKENSFLAFVKYEDKIISGSLILTSKENAHYHLSGSNEDYLKYYPNNFLIYNLIKILKEKNLKRFHLGGGLTNNNDDPLFNFKKRFSDKYHDYYIGKMIVDHERYLKVCNLWEETFPEKKEVYKDLFLKWRM